MQRLGKWILAFLVLAGCACPCAYCDTAVDQALTSADVIGVWRSANYGDFGLLEFTDDGDFFAENIQFLNLSSWPNSKFGTASVAGSGQWELAPDVAGDKPTKVELRVEVIGDQLQVGGSSSLASERDLGQSPRLSTFIGDPDEGRRVDFVKCGDCGPVPGHRALGTPAPVNAEQLVGAWRDDAGDKLRLGADGGYTASALLNFYDNQVQPATGQWRVAAPGHDPGGPMTTVVLGVGTVLRSYATPDGLVLATVSSDPAIHRQQVYRRVTESG